MQAPTLREVGEKLFLDNLDTIERALRFASTRASLRDAEGEDFGSYAKIRLIENDYRILREFEDRCNFARYISIVIHRFLLDYRIHLWGKWHPSAAAKRLGPVAIELETILHRDGRTLQEAFPMCRELDPTITPEAVEILASKLPRRIPRPRPVEIETVVGELHVTADRVYDDMLEAERATLSNSAATAVRAALDGFPDDDRLVLRLHYGGGLTIAQIARVMRVDQKPVYRRVKRCLRELRQRLEASGINWAAVEEILAGRSSDLDFGLEMETRLARPSFSIDRADETEESRVDST